jgi:hypothetical protein
VWARTTLWPFFSRRSETRRQHQPPCQAPWTRTNVLGAVCAGASTIPLDAAAVSPAPAATPPRSRRETVDSLMRSSFLLRPTVEVGGSVRGSIESRHAVGLAPRWHCVNGGGSVSTAPSGVVAELPLTQSGLQGFHSVGTSQAPGIFGRLGQRPLPKCHDLWRV